MTHTREEVIRRVRREFRRLDRLVAGLSAAEWRKLVPRPETKERWTVKDALAHITYWKEGVVLAARGQRRQPESRLGITEGNHLVYVRYHKRTPRQILEWHRQVQADLLKALREAPDAWFARPSRADTWPFDADEHSAVHRVKDIEGALGKGKAKAG